MKIIREIEFTKIRKFLQNNISCPTHWPEWNIIISEYLHTYFFYFSIYKNNVLIGICPIHKIKNNKNSMLRSGQYGYIPYGGWLFSNINNLSTFKVPLLLNESIIGYSLPLLSVFNYNYDNFSTSTELTLIIDLTKSIDEIWKQEIESKRRNMIRKAEKFNVIIKKLDIINYQQFYHLYLAANLKYGINSLPSKVLYQLLFKTNEIKFTGFLCYLDGNIQSAIVTVSDKDYCLYWIGMNQPLSQNLGQGDLLQWNAIKYAKESGCKYYDMCYIEKEKLPNIYNFKKGFTKTEIPIIRFSKSTFLYKVFNRINKEN